MSDCLEFFLSYLKKDGVVIELGTKKWGTQSTHHKSLWPDAKHIGVDFLDGEDVDVVADAMTLSKAFDENSVDAVFSASTFEHISKPWLAAEEIIKVLKPGGVFFIQSHFCFPVHGYPHDYFRYTPEAYKVLFEKASVVKVGKEFPSILIPHESVKVWDRNAPIFLNSLCVGIK